MVKNLLNVFTVSLLLSGSCYADPGDKVIIQLLVDEKDFFSFKCKIKSNLNHENSIPHPHVSFIEVDDKDNIIRNNYQNFVEKISNLLIEKNKKSQLQFIGDNVSPFKSEKTGVTYWCLEDYDKRNISQPNNLLKELANETKESIENFILNYKTSASPTKSSFSMKTPGQIVESIAKQTEENAQSYVSFSKGFPHVSVAKGDDLRNSLFSQVNKVTNVFNIKGTNFIYTFGSPDPNSRIPQIFIEKDFSHPEYTLSSKFNCLQGYNGSYPSSSDLFYSIGSLNSSYFKEEIDCILSESAPKKQKTNAPALTYPPVEPILQQGKRNAQLQNEMLIIKAEKLNYNMQNAYGLILENDEKSNKRKHSESQAPIRFLAPISQEGPGATGNLVIRKKVNVNKGLNEKKSLPNAVKVSNADMSRETETPPYFLNPRDQGMQAPKKSVQEKKKMEIIFEEPQKGGLPEISCSHAPTISYPPINLEFQNQEKNPQILGTELRLKLKLAMLKKKAQREKKSGDKDEKNMDIG